MLGQPRPHYLRYTNRGRNLQSHCDGDGFGLTGKIVGYLPGLEQSVADDLVQQAHQVCPYSKATRGNVGVDVSAKV